MSWQRERPGACGYQDPPASLGASSNLSPSPWRGMFFGGRMTKPRPETIKALMDTVRQNSTSSLKDQRARAGRDRPRGEATRFGDCKCRDTRAATPLEERGAALRGLLDTERQNNGRLEARVAELERRYVVRASLERTSLPLASFGGALPTVLSQMDTYAALPNRFPNADAIVAGRLNRGVRPHRLRASLTSGA